MARIRLTDFEDLGTSGAHSATSWQVAKDPDFIKIIDESLNDKVNLIEWNTPLPKLPEDIEEDEKYPFYSDETKLYARVKIFIDKSESRWFTIGPKSQTVQKVIVTEKDQPDRWSNTKELGWSDSPVDDIDILTPKGVTE